MKSGKVEDTEIYKEKRKIGQKNEARKKWMKSGKVEDTEIYKEKRKIGEKLCRRKKKEWWESKLKNLEQQRKSNNTRKFYKEVQKERTTEKESRSRNAKINLGIQRTTEKESRSRNAKINLGILEEEELKAQWKKHYVDLQSTESDELEPIQNNNEEAQISLEELEQVINKLKTDKAAGPDS
ncbi:hypothetical protein QE152_g32516 [Popillia japonica]|uniref:Uncharacterized protein n=1 Tax=Popillia japonica TaxID=7064 RepID=A0AAW1IZ87_POPJA